MAKAPPAFQFYPSDFVMGTLHLDPESVGCYILLLSHQWTHGTLPSDEEKLARICRMSPKPFERVWSDLGAKFVDDGDGGLVNPRLQLTREKQVEGREKKIAAGRKGGRRRASDVA